ncbi:MAG: twin-arginine translocase TatA/TatE family subunit [Muribaculaceae bacterium]|nr:twin-arginine translocase TatA/TatE family subunit [Muribaculaceae bacterium]
MIPCIFNLGTGEIIVILVVVLLLFGAKRIPELARSLGKGVSSFKEGLNDAKNEIERPIEADKEK